MLYKRPGSPYWWVRFTVGGRRIRRSTETTSRKQAAEFAARLREREWSRVHAGTRTWQEACRRWLEDHQHKRSLVRDQIIIEWTLPHLGDALLHEIDRDRLDEIRKLKARETSPATANRYLALVRSILNAAARDWGWLPAAPKVPMFPKQSGDYQWLTRAEFAALLEHLPAHTRQLARFAVATGLRRTNVTHLRWSQVDRERAVVHVQGRETKAGKALAIPLNDDALAVLGEQAGRHDVWVFPYQGAPVYQVATKAWRAAVTAIGRPGFRFHDLRHTWASWHVQAGTPLNALQALGGWADLQMVTRYGHLDSLSLSQHAKAVSVSGHNAGTVKRRKPRKAA